MNLNILLWSIVYVVAGYFMTKIVCRYLENLGDKVSTFDDRYRKNLYFKLRATTERQKNIWEIVLLAIWPVFCVAAIIKAEWNYDSIVRRNARSAP